MSALDSARRYLDNARAVGELEDPDALVRLASMGGAGKVQRAHAGLAGVAALVSMAESLDRIADLLDKRRPSPAQYGADPGTPRQTP